MSGSEIPFKFIVSLQWYSIVSSGNSAQQVYAQKLINGKGKKKKQSSETYISFYFNVSTLWMI